MYINCQCTDGTVACSTITAIRMCGVLGVGEGSNEPIGEPMIVCPYSHYLWRKTLFTRPIAVGKAMVEGAGILSHPGSARAPLVSKPNQETPS